MDAFNLNSALAHPAPARRRTAAPVVLLTLLTTTALSTAYATTYTLAKPDDAVVGEDRQERGARHG